MSELDYLAVTALHLAVLVAIVLVFLASCRDITETHYPPAPQPNGQLAPTARPVPKYVGGRANRVRNWLSMTVWIALSVVVTIGLIEVGVYFRALEFSKGTRLFGREFSHDGLVAATALALCTVLVWCLCLKACVIRARLRPDWSD